MPEIIPKEAPDPRSLLGYDGTDFYVLKVDSDGHLQIDVKTSALPTLAATSTKQGQILLALQYLYPLVTALQSVATDRLIVRGENQLFSFKDQVKGTAEHTMTENATYTLLGPAVDPGEVWVLTTLFARTWNNTLTAFYVGFETSGAYTWGAGRGATVAKQPINTVTPMILLPGDKPAAYFYEAKNGDYLALFWNGYSMTLET